jgi:ATP/ADP translocase
MRSLVTEARAAFRERPGRTVAMIALAWWVMFTYGLARPAAVSMFLGQHGQAGLPAVWLAGAGLAVLATAVYNRFSRRIPMNRMTMAVAALSGVGFAALLIWQRWDKATATFALHMWTEVYIVVLVEVFWTLCNFTFPIAAAKWLYGIFLVSGSIGVILGALAVKPIAHRFDTPMALWFAVGALAVVATIAPFFTAPPAQRDRARSELFESLRTVKRSRYLGLLILLIAVAQVVITLIDYQYNGFILARFPVEVERTVFLGEVDAGINAIAIALQGLAGPILSLGGVPLVLVFIPLLILSLGVGFLLSPSFAIMVVLKIASKASDYSLGRAAKEILYIPLNYAEKTQGKAFADVMSYRVAKAGASAVLAVWTASVVALTGVCLLLTTVWMWLAFALGRRFKKSSE